MQTYRYTPRLVQRLGRQVLMMAVVYIVPIILAKWFSSDRHYTNKIPDTLILGTMSSLLFYLGWRYGKKSLGAIVLTLDSDSLTVNSWGFPRRDATTLEVTRTGFTLRGIAPKQILRITDDLEGYSDLLAALRCWPVKIHESDTDLRANRMRRPWLIALAGSAVASFLIAII